MFKFVKEPVMIGWRGQSLFLKANSVWDAADPVCRAHPELFADSPEVVETSSGALYRGVEQATAAPGEKRASR